MAIALFFMRRDFGGGSTSFTAHLYMSLKHAGYFPFIYRVTERGDGRQRPFAQYAEVFYQNISEAEALRLIKFTPSLMTGACHPKFLEFNYNIILDMIDAGMRCVIHDPNEFHVYEHAPFVEKPILIRPSMKQLCPAGVYIPHPYMRIYTEVPTGLRPLMAVSISRVTFVKRTEIILAANRLLSPEKQIIIRGAENRLYTKHKLSKLFSEYEQGQTGYPLTWGAGAQECSQAKFMVDMSGQKPGGGGSSQYSFMEAWDAGAIPIIHEDWIHEDGEMQPQINCLTTDGPESLARLLNVGDNLYIQDIVTEGRDLLDTLHHPLIVADQYAEELGVTRG